jgi:hypothetical protein
LRYAEAEVGEDPVLGASMKQSEYSRRIRAKSLKSPNRPSGIAYDGSGCEMDSRRWDGRAAESCGKCSAMDFICDPWGYYGREVHLLY